MYGEQGSGKTHTAINLAIGICKDTKNTKIVFFDTERGAPFHLARVQGAGLQMHVEFSTSLAGIVDLIWELDKTGDCVLIIDSVTHIYRELISSYCKAKNIKAPVLRDWGFIKPIWYEFTDAFIHSRVHVIACGRAGMITENTYNDQGKIDGFEVVGTKMKAEAEFSYEAGLEIEMERVLLTEEIKRYITERKPEKRVFLDNTICNKALVKKDRNPDIKNSLNGAIIYYPLYADFTPHITCLNLGKDYVPRTSDDSSVKLFSPEAGPNLAEYRRRRDILLGRLKENVLPLCDLVGTSKETVLKRTNVFMEVFGTAASAEIEDMQLDKLDKGIQQIMNKYGPKT
jgi:hypothetical protein